MLGQNHRSLWIWHSARFFWSRLCGAAGRPLAGSIAFPLVVPLLALGLATLAFRVSDADIVISRLFYDSSAHAWAGTRGAGWSFLYDYGNLPGLAMGIGGLTLGLGSLIWARLRPYRRAGFFLAAVLALGPGLLVNGLLKPHWCRPRPAEIVDFGGAQQFAHVWEWNGVCTSKSFPSGHASMGFYLMAPAFLLSQRRRRLALAFVLAGLVCGGGIGLARIAQGGHFASDVVWSGGIVYLSAWTLGVLLLRRGMASPPAVGDSTAGIRSAAASAPTDRSAGAPAGMPMAEPPGGDRRRAA